MSNTFEIVEPAPIHEVAPHAAATSPDRRTERGMVTIEYAVGAVMVIALVGVIILAINSGQFQGLVNQFIDFIIKFLQTSIK